MNVQWQELVTYWTKSAADDWHTTQSLFDKQEYVSALFFAHLYLEKVLKALIVQQTHQHAPYGHALHVLGKKAQLPLTAAQVKLLRRVSDYNIKARYPDHKFAFKKKCTREFCRQELDAIQKFAQWLQTMIEH